MSIFDLLKNTISAPDGGLNREGISGAGNNLATMIGLAPAVAGGLFAFKAMRSNEGLFVNSLSTNAYSSQGTKVGSALRHGQIASREAQKESARKLQRELLEKGTIRQRITTNAEEFRVQLEAISNLLDDPASGIGNADEIKKRISDLILHMGDTATQSEADILEETAQILLSSDSQAELFEKHYKNAQRAESYIAAPTIKIPGTNQAFESLEGGVFKDLEPARAKEAQEMFEEYKKMFGNIELFKVKETIADPSDNLSIYARINRGTGGNHIGVVPISLAKTHAGEKAQGVPIVRPSKGLSTSYFTPRGFIDQAEAQSALAEGRTPQIERLEMNVFRFVRKLKETRGVSAVTPKAINEYISMFGEMIPRAANVDKDIAEIERTRASVRGQQAIIIGKGGSIDKLRPLLLGVTNQGQTIFDSASDMALKEIPLTKDRYGKIGLVSNKSLIENQLHAISNLTTEQRRILTPATARFEQIQSRTGGFIMEAASASDKTRIASKKSLFVAGELVPGGMNRTVLIDFAEQSGLSEGEMYMRMGTETTIRHPLQKTVLDPRTRLAGGKPMMSTRFYQELIEEMEKKGKLVLEGKKLRDFLETTGGFIGTSGADRVSIRNTAGLQRLSLQVEHIDPETGKVFLAGTTDTIFGGAAPVNKLYSTLGKGMARKYNQGMGQEFLGRVGLELPGVFKEAGISGITQGGTVGKAGSYLVEQMVSGAGVALGYNDERIRQLLLEAGEGLDAGEIFKSGSKQGEMTSRYITGVAKFLVSKLKGKGVSEEAIGMVMAGFVHSAKKKKMGLGMDMVSEVLGEQGKAREIAEKGIGIGRATFMSGPLSVLHGANEGSMEQRMFQQFNYQLKNMYGFSANEANDYLTALLARKATSANELDVLSELMKTQASIIGARMELMPDRPIIGVSEFIDAGKTPEAMDRFLKKHTEGFVLDLAQTEGLNPQGARLITAWTGEKGMSRITFAGGDILEKMKGTVVKTATGEDKLIGGQYATALEHFAQNLETAAMSANQSDREIERAKQQLQRFPEEMAEVFAGASNRILRGKLRGSGQATVMGARTDLLGLSDRQRNLLTKLKGKEGGRVAVMSHQAFVDSMRTFIPGATDEFLATGELDISKKGKIRKGAALRKVARKKAKKEAGEKFKRFFLGMEGREGKARLLGVTQFARRDPSLGLAHIFEVETYRDPTEMILGRKDAKDLAFEEIKRSDKGKKQLAKLAKSLDVEEITSFAHIRELSMTDQGIFMDDKRKKAVTRFFDKMASQVSDFFGMEGGGYIGFIERKAKVHYGNVSEGGSLDMSVAYAAGGDMDGDVMSIINPAGRDRMKKLRRSSKKAGQQLDEVRALRAIYGKEAEKGLKKFAESQTAITSIGEMVAQGLKKEQAAVAVGPVDIALDRIRFGIMQAEGDSAAKRKMLVVTDILEELMTLKSKKLMRDTGLSETMVRAVQLASEGDVSVMEYIFKNIAFSDTSGVDILSKDAKALLSMGENAAEKALDISLNMEEMRPVIVSALERSKMISAAEIKTIRGIMGLAQANTSERLRGFNVAYLGQESFQAAAATSDLETAVSSTFGRILNRVQTASSLFDKRAIGPLALGLAGSIGLTYGLGQMGAGGGGYSPEPLMMPGEVINPELKTMIAGGNIFRQQNPAPSLEGMQRQGNPYTDLNDRVINSRTSYTGRSNAYSMRGEIASSDGILNMANYLASGGASGSIMINDTRRPITANYIDRMMDS